MIYKARFVCNTALVCSWKAIMCLGRGVLLISEVSRFRWVDISEWSMEVNRSSSCTHVGCLILNFLFMCSLGLLFHAFAILFYLLFLALSITFTGFKCFTCFSFPNLLFAFQISIIIPRAAGAWWNSLFFFLCQAVLLLFYIPFYVYQVQSVFSQYQRLGIGLPLCWFLILTSKAKYNSLMIPLRGSSCSKINQMIWKMAFKKACKQLLHPYHGVSPCSLSRIRENQDYRYPGKKMKFLLIERTSFMCNPHVQFGLREVSNEK